MWRIGVVHLQQMILLFSAISYQYILEENLQLAPDVAPVDGQPLLNLVLVEPWGRSFTHGLRAGQARVFNLTRWRPSAIKNIFL